MPVSTTSAIERIARVLAGQRLNAIGEGSQSSVADHVDKRWRDYEADAVAVLKTLREPDAKMASAGDAEIWKAMVQAALE